MYMTHAIRDDPNVNIMFSEAICMSNHTIYPCSRKKFGQVMHFTVSVLKEGSNMIFHSLTFAREVLKTEGEARGFQPSRGTLEC